MKKLLKLNLETLKTLAAKETVSVAGGTGGGKSAGAFEDTLGRGSNFGSSF